MKKTKTPPPTILVPPGSAVDDSPPTEFLVIIAAIVIFVLGWGGKAFYDHRQDVAASDRIKDVGKCAKRMRDIVGYSPTKSHELVYSHSTGNYYTQSGAINEFCDWMQEDR